MFSDFMSRVVFSKNNFKDMQPNVSFFYESKDEAIDVLDEAFCRTSPTVVVDKHPIRFENDGGFLVEAKVKKVGLRKKEEYRPKTNPSIYLQPYKEDDRKGFLLTVEILENKYLGGHETKVNARNIAIAKVLENIKYFGKTPKGGGAGID